MASIVADAVRPGSLAVATASPDPPFELVRDGDSTGFDFELMRAVCRHLELAFVPVRYAGVDFNGIFDGLAPRTYDAVISGTTITAERAAIAFLSRPYLQFDQGVAINVEQSRQPTRETLQTLERSVGIDSEPPKQRPRRGLRR